MRTLARFGLVTLTCCLAAVFVIYLVGMAALLYNNTGFRLSRPMLYEIPGAYKGWMVIHYEDPSCPPLPTKGIFLVVAVPASGRLCTSSEHPGGLVYSEFEYVYSGGKREPLAWTTAAGEDPRAQVWLIAYSPEDKEAISFVGSQQEFKRAGTPPYRVHPLPNPPQQR